MSKRKSTPKRSTPDMLRMFRTANQELHSIRVSTPILLIIQRLVNDQAFRDKVTRLMNQ